MTGENRTGFRDFAIRDEPAWGLGYKRPEDQLNEWKEALKEGGDTPAPVVGKFDGAVC